jgi:uncharacterized protein
MDARNTGACAPLCLLFPDSIAVIQRLPQKRLKNRRAIPIIQRQRRTAMSSTPAPLPRVESPCIKVCVLDANSVCLGCGRSLEEIASWSRLSADEQREICVKAAQRRQSRTASDVPGR